MQSRWLRLIDVGDGGITEARLTNCNREPEASDSFIQLIASLRRVDGMPISRTDRDEIAVRMVPLFE